MFTHNFPHTTTLATRQVAKSTQVAILAIRMLAMAVARLVASASASVPSLVDHILIMVDACPVRNTNLVSEINSTD